MRLYRRLGYEAVKREALVPHPCLKYDSGDAVLMVSSDLPGDHIISRVEPGGEEGRLVERGHAAGAEIVG